MTRTPRTLALATPHAAATDDGRAVFAAGGTAVDAALAACMTLAVVYPHMCSLGGDAIALLHAPDGTVTCVNGSGAAPAALDAARVRAALERDPAPCARGGMPWRGPHTVTVPGVLAAWDTLRRLGGRLDLPHLLAPAIGHAHDGCRVAPSLARALASEPGTYAADPGLRDLFFAQGRPLAVGRTFRQPALAATLRQIARRGPQAFYDGPSGRGYVAGLREYGSVMEPDDLARHETEVMPALRRVACGHELLTAPPNSQGYVVLQLMAALERMGMGNGERGAPATMRGTDDVPSVAPPDPLGPAAATIARLFQMTGDERDRVLCDPRARDIPISRLLDDDHVAVLTARAAAAEDTADSRRHRSPAHDPDETAADPHAGDTVACVAADSDGWAVSVIQSVYEAFGAALLEPSTGIVAHDRGACFSLDARSPALLVGGRRPPHTLMPVMVRRGSRLTLVAGTMGGEAQPQIHAHILSRLLAHAPATATAGPAAPASRLVDAVSAPRWVVDANEVRAERSVPPRCIEAWRGAGQAVTLVGDLDETVGHAQYLLLAKRAPVAAASDPRADGSAVVVTC